jgi:hypothetical protein
VEHIEISVRISLRNLKVVRHNDAPIAGSADEPYLWFAGMKVDSTTVSLANVDAASVTIHAPAAKPHNLGEAAEGVTDGKVVRIPRKLGTWETKLRGFDEQPALTQFVTVAFLAAALEHDESTDGDMAGLHARVMSEAQTRLDAELRRVLREALAGELPNSKDVEDRLKQQLSQEVIQDIAKDFGRGKIGRLAVPAIFSPAALIYGALQGANRDDFIGRMLEFATFSLILAHSMTGFDYDAELTDPKDGVTVQGGGTNLSTEDQPAAKYRITGTMERLDIKEPPTLGAMRFADGRFRLCGRTIGKRVYAHERRANGEWKRSNKVVGSGELSSGPAVAASADGKSVYTFGRGMNHRIWMHTEGGGEKWRELDDRQFATGPGAACSDDGRILWVAATGEDQQIYLKVSFGGAAGLTSGWTVLDIGKSVATSPALACSADGRTLHVAYVGTDRRLRRAKFIFDVSKKLEPVYVKAVGEEFRSAPSLAVSDKADVLWIAALGDQGGDPRRQRILRVPESPFFNGGWAKFGEPSVSAPSLACSPDGKAIHVCDIAHTLALRHRVSTNAADSWSAPELLSVDLPSPTLPAPTDTGAWF